MADLVAVVRYCRRPVAGGSEATFGQWQGFLDASGFAGPKFLQVGGIGAREWEELERN